ncbi:MAG: prephenate dehydrogenase/arogenate dehydrogenase family protein, partial [Myxococcales bacterium]
MSAPERIAIVGLGLIGGSLALALRRARPDLAIAGIDLDEVARGQALQERAVDTATTLEKASLEDFDTVVLCTPAQPLLEMLPGVAARMRPGA